MKLWFRLLGYLLTCWWRPRLTELTAPSRLTFRVWPTDLDMSLHMNNGRYLTLMDFGRLDFMVRTGVLGHVLKNGWLPVVSCALVRFRRELFCFKPFHLDTEIIDWTDTHVIFEHRLVIASGPDAGEVAAYALIKAGLYDRGERAFISIERLMALTGIYPDEKPAYAEAARFLEAEAMLYETERAKRTSL